VTMQYRRAQLSRRGESMLREGALALVRQLLDAARRRDASGLIDLYAEGAVA
jgi:hypothetical protein